ncbi:MAG TPA: AAA family ATPase [Streptosporangiaceae bacterium]|nr:AAA family ATPase [Streptosporangiaceae bacterium]
MDLPAGLAIVGRDREQAELAGALASARVGYGRAVLLLGEPGMGKTMLAGWLVGQAEQAGMQVARGGCSAAGMPPLWPWRRALAAIGLELPWRLERAAVGPSDRELVAAAIVETVAAAAARQPLLIVLEDMHWSDQVSALVAQAAAEAVAALPLALLLTCRDEWDEATDDVRRRLAELPAGVLRMVLPPLEASAVAALAHSIVGPGLDSQVAVGLAARSGGNPFFAHEVARLIAARGPAAAFLVPAGVREVLQRRLARLSQPCVSLLAAAAIVAETAAEAIEDDLLQHVSGVRQEAAAELLDEAAGGLLLEVDHAGPSRYRFRHALVREVLDHGLSAAQRGELHAAAGEALERRGGPPPAAARLAYHWSRAIGPQAQEKSVAWSLRAARDAVAGFGFEAAVTHYARALAGRPAEAIPVSVEFGEALHMCGDVVAGREVLLAAAREAAAAGRAEDLARAALALGGGLAGFEVPLQDEEQAELLRKADAVLPPGETALRAAVRGRLSLALAGSAPEADRMALARDAVKMASEAGDQLIEMAVLAAYCDAIAGPDYVRERTEAATRMLSLATDLSEASLQRQASVLLARRLLLVALLEQGDLPGAEQQAVAYERAARRLGIARYGWLPEIWRAMRALLNGEPDSALEHAAAAEAIGRRADSFNAQLMAFTARMQAHLDRGTAAEYADDVSTLMAEAGSEIPGMYYAAPARLLLAAGDESQARAVLRALLAGPAEARPKDAEWLECHWAMADLAISLDDRAAAIRLAADLAPYEALWAVDGMGGAVFGVVAEQLGRLAAYLGQPGEAARYLATARDRYEQAGAPALRARLDALAVPQPRATAELPGPADGVGLLRRTGQVWLAEWRGRRSIVPDSKGIRDLAVLLARPGEAVTALELVEAAGGPPAAAAGGSLGPVLDATARRAYQQRLADLESELAEAEDNADIGHVERLRAERSMLAAELADALGLGGRARFAGDPAERARKAVTMRIRAAINTIAAQDDTLARHLRNTIRTGRLCSYQPEETVSWRI